MEPLRRGVGEHHQRVERVRSVGNIDGVRRQIAPALLPLQLDLGRVVARTLLSRVGIHRVTHDYKVAVPSITVIVEMHQLSPMGPTLELTEAERQYTPSWDGIPVVDVHRSFFSPFVSFFQRHAAFAIVFSVSVAQVGIGWIAYRLFHLLSPDVQRAFLASGDVRWTLAVGVVWIAALLVLASVMLLRLTSSRLTAPIVELAHVSESVANGDLTVPFAPATTANEVGRLSRATSAIIVTLRRLAATMRASARDVTNLSRQITSASENMAAAAQQDSDTSRPTRQETQD